MKKYTKSFFSLLLISLALFTTSCKKKCVMDINNEDKGWIEENVIFYPQLGYITTALKGNYVITESSPFADEFLVSIDGGEKAPVDFNNYTILCYPIITHCNAQFVRDVSFNSVNQTVEYSITVTQCAQCEEERFTENFVLVPKFPSNYNVTYDISYVNLE
jgi:hypothetical protein